VLADLPRIVDFGDAALLVVLGGDIDPATNARVHVLARRLETARPAWPGIGRGVPGHASLLVPYDSLKISAADARAAVADLLIGREEPAEEADLPPLPLLEIPVRYGGPDGPDLDAVAAATGLSPEDVVRLHAARTYRVYMLGFTPGFAYLGMLPPELELPRRPTPRTSVPAGSVAIAARQTAVYPAVTPGGWHLIGRTGLPLWDPARTPPALLEPGRPVRFVPE
jgi:KipI family sensor histidine kinase inhibitor